MSTPAVPGGPESSRDRDADILASDRERDEAATALREHTAAGRLTLEEFGTRLDAAGQARTRGDLAAVLADLPTAPGSSPRPAARITHREWAVAIFGDDARGGRWNPGRRTGAVSVFGDAVVDLRKAEVTGSAVDVEAYAVFGDVTILVPEGVPVEVSRIAVFGDVTVAVEGEALPGMPVVRVRAVSVFGDVDVRSSPRPPGLLARLFGR